MLPSGPWAEPFRAFGQPHDSTLAANGTTVPNRQFLELDTGHRMDYSEIICGASCDRFDWFNRVAAQKVSLLLK
jgi:hypothetical protein